MEKKYAVIRENAKIYQKGSKKLKTQILDEFERILGMNRQYLSFPPQSMPVRRAVCRKILLN